MLEVYLLQRNLFYRLLRMPIGLLLIPHDTAPIEYFLRNPTVTNKRINDDETLPSWQSNKSKYQKDILSRPLPFNRSRMVSVR